MNRDTNLIKNKINKISFGLLSSQEIEKLSVHSLTSKDLYDVITKSPMSDGPLDRRLGVSNKKDKCLTCNENIVNCLGHFGNIKLILPVYHIGLIKQTLFILSCVCKNCGKILLSEKKKNFYKNLLREIKNKNDQILLLRKINVECKKTTLCLECQTVNGTIKKGTGFKILHEIEKNNGRKDKKNFSKKIEDINPLVALNIFSMIKPEDYEYLGLEDNPEKFIIQNVIVPPACIRPSVGMAERDSTNEDDLTIKISEIIHTNFVLKESIEKGNPVNIINDDWDLLQLQCALMINSDLPQVNVQSQPIKGLVQRLKGKSGRFRCNLSGKRVDFSGRTVISPNPNLTIDQVDVPEYMAKILTIPEKVTKFNKEKLQKLIKNGPLIYPGANYIINNKCKKFLLYGGKEDELLEGDIVERHLTNNDVVLFNRQPSLHRMSIMAHYVNIHKNKTLRFNECVCSPYNADFDGDEMNIHVPQTLEAIAECIELMGVKENIVTARHGEPLIAATQDFITALYLITSKDTFFDRKKFGQLLAHFCRSRIEISPVIVKPVELFTGKQLVEAMIHDSLEDKRLIKEITLNAKNRSFSKWDHTDSFFVVREGKYLFGRIDKNIIGGESKKNSILYLLMTIEKHSSAQMMYNITRVASRYLGEVGFSIGLVDVLPGKNLQIKKTEVVDEGYKKCKEIIKNISEINKEESEMEISSTLNQIREECGSICIKELSTYNSPIIMQACGSKGSKINVSQMIACVGQQIISGKRIPNGMLDRTLPHFDKFSMTPESKGFVENSFYTGMKPAEFFFHAVSGREGLVDTAVKTAETGYTQRRLMKALEDLNVKYDYSVRSSFNEIIQYKYGEDGIDPLVMECDDFIDLEKVFISVETKLTAFSPNLLNDKSIDNEYNDKLTEQDSYKKILICNKNKTLEFDHKNNLTEDKIVKIIYEKFDSMKKDPFIRNYCLNILNDDFYKKISDFLLSKINSVIFNGYKFIKILSTCQFFNLFFNKLKNKIKNSVIEPGTAVGAIAGQSIGEPGTQMTLKTFHFAGVASMNITLGVPRLIEIINAVSNINTPIINVSLSKNDLLNAQLVKGRLLKVLVRDICSKVTESVSKNDIFVDFEFDINLINKLRLQVDTKSIKQSLNINEQISIIDDNKLRIIFKNGINQALYNIQKIKKKIMNTKINGLSSVNKVLLHNDKGIYKCIVEGHGLQTILGTKGVDYKNTTSNAILEIQEVLGIEAARAHIISEIEYVVGKHGIKIDPRHVMLLADTMTYKGEVLGITRFGISKMSCSTLMLASFEQTSDHLFDAAIRNKSEDVRGVSESIILGKPIGLGTGGVELYWDGENKLP
ncbi:DNA-directed RNA polymerase III subunit RPC1 [Vairimorpha necatrix]|uniref:DNA-directed RNA polymerase subunit n=1 Tax=Vairimorpha necatrix TaxID=6039 RepID=A0AAX4JAT7_9MICR